MSIKKRINKLEKLLSYTPGEIILITQLNKNIYKRLDYDFKEINQIYDEKEVIELQDKNNVLLIHIVKEKNNL